MTSQNPYGNRLYSHDEKINSSRKEDGQEPGGGERAYMHIRVKRESDGLREEP